MKKFLVCSAIFTALIFVVSCGGDSSKPADGGDSEKKSLGEICTGQDKCYYDYGVTYGVMDECPTSSSDDFFGQDAQYTSKCTAQSFAAKTVYGDDIVFDNNTGLTWEQLPSSSSYTWDDAPNHCNDLNSSDYGGKSNWRLPNPLEFLTIVDNSKSGPATNSNFTKPIFWTTYWWTSKEYKGNTSYAYAFDYDSGRYYGNNSDSYLKTKRYQVLCVSGDEMQPATSSDFTTQTVSGKAVVTDLKTGLMWQKDYVSGKTWQQALKYCEDSTYAGYSDWRLPNKNELASLINYEKSETPYSYFPDMPSEWFWSSSTVVYFTESAWYMNVSNGTTGNGKKTDNSYVRCVRN